MTSPVAPISSLVPGPKVAADTVPAAIAMKVLGTPSTARITVRASARPAVLTSVMLEPAAGMAIPAASVNVMTVAGVTVGSLLSLSPVAEGQSVPMTCRPVLVSIVLVVAKWITGCAGRCTVSTWLSSNAGRHQ